MIESLLQGSRRGAAPCRLQILDFLRCHNRYCDFFRVRVFVSSVVFFYTPELVWKPDTVATGELQGQKINCFSVSFYTNNTQAPYRVWRKCNFAHLLNMYS